ncbi:hypothetical protein AK812_SmicGene2849 [Symbiodinium microadriaticum]|uniref:Uncharacterized protein n=1 Tax=Symbiodinium microadriaticum TaxID=2951 RepID=A0A1Q9F097_SYMMI|nr:hypothetical protein AK812_SmicGene2849 [Symbiodinium microadriaticum]
MRAMQRPLEGAGSDGTRLAPYTDADFVGERGCPGFVFWCMGLAHLPPRLCYELCFGKEYRQSAEKRLQAVLDIYGSRA